jgi:diadenosine tetraphosphate (Ap4A) HIT family hydrolase
MGCPFCEIENRILLVDGVVAYATPDTFPVSRGHTLIIPKRHVENYFDLLSVEREEIKAILEVCKSLLDYQFRPDGYNLGVNVGVAAGQTVPHVHIHVIPRYSGDMSDPRGGVRGVISERRIYIVK